jgi:predicted amidophosphoribosyltransferase
VILDLLAPPLCWSCGSRAAHGEPLCVACRRTLRFLAPTPVGLGGVEVWAPVAYDGAAASLVKALKFRGATAIAGTMAALIVANAPTGVLEGALVPVPLHPARRRTRPFNQAGLIAEAIFARTHLPILDWLRRTGPDHRQVGRGRAARLSGAGSIEAIGWAPPAVLLVDDVVTTGATLAACAAAVRNAGAERVAAVAFARTAGR